MFRSLFAILALVATCYSISIVRKDDIAMSGGIPLAKSNNNFFGIVDPISECEGSCSLEPGKVYNCENDFVAGSNSSSLSIWVEICRRNDCSIIVQTELPNSSVLPGLVYTVKYDIVPNDMFSGEIIEFRTYIYHTESYLMETCVSADVNIL
ncbi:uncharacterized protein LOC110841630 isoform X3 [Folsomia candida]|uniref:uncharacterized protein LOC110841630 isoform X3 n=1 Tax=Folsomia candida TaxID=158441 RepID=UPI001604BC58|nr:uncharacterized protein LOC110841630 isoform X3 [Folsomia candida]